MTEQHMLLSVEATDDDRELAADLSWGLEGAVEWASVREVRSLPPKGMRLVLHSGRRVEFPGISDTGVALDDEVRRIDADGVRGLATELARGAAAG
jgi:hypothetical protein